MKKRFVVAGIVVFSFLLVLSGVFFLRAQKKEPAVSVVETTKSASDVKRVLWDDAAGFTFTHDPSLIINSHPEDEENYAHVELSKLGENGKIIVWASDTNAQTIPQWVSGQKRFFRASTIDTTLGGQPAVKINGTLTTGVMTVGALYDGLIFYIDAFASDSAYISGEFDKISDSFILKPVEDVQTDQQDSAGYGTVFDEEEIVE